MNAMQHPWDSLPDSWTRGRGVTTHNLTGSSGVGSVKSTSQPARQLNNLSAGIKGASSAVSTGLMATGVGAPIGAAMQLSGALGGLVTQGLSSSASNQIRQDYLRDSNIANSTGNRWANSRMENENQKLELATTASGIGGTFGPLGAWLGWLAGKANAKDAPTATTNSFGGNVDPVKGGINVSGTTSALNDNVE